MAKKAAKSKEEQAAIKVMQDAYKADPPVKLIRSKGGPAVMVRRSQIA